MGTKNLYENGPNPFLLFGNKNMVRPTLMGTKNLYETGPNPFFLFAKFVHYVQNYYRHRTDVIVCWLPKFHGFNLAPLFHYTKGRGKFC